MKLLSEYFVDISKMDSETQQYMSKTLSFYEQTGILELLVQSNKRGKLAGNEIRNGKSAWQEGNFAVHNLGELERETKFYGKFGGLMAIPSSRIPLIEVRVNLIVAHELAHQLQDYLSSELVDRLKLIFEATLSACKHESTENQSEVVLDHDVASRHFVSGYARTGFWEYWAECFACFADQGAMKALKETQAEAYDLLCQLFLHPEVHLQPEAGQELALIREKHSINVETVKSLLY